MNLTFDQNATVLIVDDTPANLGVLSDTLDQAGLEVWVAQSGKIALERVKYALPDLILLDVMMPEIDGFETCHQLKANPETKDIPVIFMTALSDTENKVQGFQYGAVDYITKPFQQEEVLARIKLHLKLYDLAEKLEEKNALLEQKVTEVNQAYHDLQQMQLQLIQGEKMSSLGQMTAGIAHEINNPVNFIHGNIVHIDSYTQDLLKVVQAYQAHYPNPPQTLQAILDDVELDFLSEDLIKLLQSMKVGTDRIRQIVLSLRNFSRVDESEFKVVDLHEGIDSTLLILRHRLVARPGSPAIEVVRDYGQLPTVECYPGQLNQVFMNLLANAIDVLEESVQQPQADQLTQSGKIWISTRMTDNQHVQVTIADNGMGMTEAVRARLFTPFFTTKAVGKGTGLGLSISYQIVINKHHGKLWCDSTPGEGTKFVIEIPVHQPEPMLS